MVVLYFIFFIIAISFESRDIKNRNMVMAFACTVLAIAAGMRDLSWSDTGVYMISFTDYTPTLFDFSFSDRPLGYGEKGFYFLAICVKTLTDNYHIFFLVVAAISFIALYKDIKEFSYDNLLIYENMSNKYYSYIWKLSLLASMFLIII